jgi:RIO-like serine/threonine protein kinase
MVVMDRVEGKTIWQLHKEGRDLPAIVAKQVEAAVSVIHQAGIVFGDLRENNILYTQTDGSAEGRVFLVDFDWADRDGEGRYPATLNIDSQWERSVSPYGVMQKAHDLWQVERIKKLCAQDA